MKYGPGHSGDLFFSSTWAKGWSKCFFLQTMKIEHGTTNQLFIKVRHRDALKTVPGNGFEKTLKNNETTIGKSMVFDSSKPLKHIDKQITLLDIWAFTKLMKKRCQRGSQKSVFLIQNGDMGLPGLTYPLIFDVLV